MEKKSITRRTIRITGSLLCFYSRSIEFTTNLKTKFLFTRQPRKNRSNQKGERSSLFS